MICPHLPPLHSPLLLHLLLPFLVSALGYKNKTLIRLMFWFVLKRHYKLTYINAFFHLQGAAAVLQKGEFKVFIHFIVLFTLYLHLTSIFRWSHCGIPIYMLAALLQNAE